MITLGRVVSLFRSFRCARESPLSQGTPGDFRGPQGTPGNPREPQGTPWNSKGLQEISDNTRRKPKENPRKSIEPQGPLEGTPGNPQGTPVNSRRLQGTRLQSKSIGHASVSRELQPCCVCYAIFKLLHWQITCT